MSDILHFKTYSVVRPGLRVKIDLRRKEKEFIEAQQWLADRVLEDSRACMPHTTGNLQQRSHTERKGAAVVFPGPYGRFQYGGKVMVDPDTGSPWARKGAEKVLTNRPLTYSNPQAVPEWFEHAKKLHGQFWIEGVKDILGGK